jgi:hypothetical protein
MNMPESPAPNVHIATLIKENVVVDTFKAREAYALLEYLACNHDRVKGLPYSRYFESVEGLLFDQLVIYTTKLFESSRDKRVVSIPSILEFIENHSQELKIIEINVTYQHLTDLGVNAVNPTRLTQSELTDLIVATFKARMPNKEVSEELNRLKMLRDKRIAHREFGPLPVGEMDIAKDTLGLIEFAEKFISTISFAYTSSSHVYGIPGYDSFIKEDAQFCVGSLANIFRTLTPNSRLVVETNARR